MALSGWCATRGRPDCARCRSERCGHECHAANPAQPRGLLTVSGVDAWDNETSPNGALTPSGSDRTFLSNQKGGLVL